MPTVSKQPPTGRPPPGPATKGGSAWDLIANIRMLVYGESGTGKTTFASTFPGPILWLLCSGGNKPGELRSIDTAENRKRITPVVLTSFEQCKEVVKERAGDFATTVLDHASGFADLVLADIIGKPVPAQKGWGLASQQQYGQLALQCKEAFRDLLNLPGNVVIIAQERVFGGREDGTDPELIKPKVGAALTPSVTGWLNPACDFVVQAFKRPVMVPIKTKVGGKESVSYERGKGAEFCLRCEVHDVFMTKFRVPGGVKTDVIVNPNYDKLMRAIKGEKVS